MTASTSSSFLVRGPRGYLSTFPIAARPKWVSTTNLAHRFDNEEAAIAAASMLRGGYAVVPAVDEVAK